MAFLLNKKYFVGVFLYLTPPSGGFQRSGGFRRSIHRSLDTREPPTARTVHQSTHVVRREDGRR